MSRRVPPFARTLYLQPRPVATHRTVFRTLGRPVTAIMRLWTPEAAARCKLCPIACRARPVAGTELVGCHMIVNREISQEAAPLFSPRGLRIQSARKGGAS